MHKVNRSGGLSLLLALALLSPIATHAQTTVTTRESNFEIIAVDGNTLVVRDQKGTRELTVPPDFVFTVDGKSMTVGDLKAGMKGTATITNTTIQRPVYVTVVKFGTVTNQTGRTVVIKEDNGPVRRFTQTEIDARGVRLFMDGKAIRIRDLNRGDRISATIVSEGEPEILTAQAVDAELAAAAAAPPTAAAPEAEAAAAESPAAEPAPEPQAAMEQAAPAEVTEEASAPALPKPWTSNPFFWLFVVIVVVALIWVLMRRKVKK
jgi:hypothetical protein